MHGPLNFLSSQNDLFWVLYPWTAAAPDVFCGDLRRVGGEDDRPLQNVGQLAYIARPSMLFEGLKSTGREALAGSIGAKAREEMARQRRQIVEAFAQCGNLKREDGEAVVEVETEGAVDDTLLEVAVGGGEDADVDPRDLVVSDALNLAALEEAEELGLNRERELSNLVQEERAAVRGLNAAGAGLHGSREGAAGVSEELGFEKGFGDGGAVEHREGFGRATDEAMDRGGDDLFSGAPSPLR